MGTKNNPGRYDCHSLAHPDEPIFTLRAKDPLAPALIRSWVELRKMAFTDAGVGFLPSRNRELEKQLEALLCADAMEHWRKDGRTTRPDGEGATPATWQATVLRPPGLDVPTAGRARPSLAFGLREALWRQGRVRREG